MKKLIAGALGVVLAATGMVGCSQDKGGGQGEGGGRIALIAKANASDYWSRVGEGAKQAGKDLGVEVVFNGPDTESEGDKQLNQLQSAINDSPLGIGFAPQDGAQDGAPRLLDEAKAALPERVAEMVDKPMGGRFGGSDMGRPGGFGSGQNVEAAAKIGAAIAERAKAKGVEEVVFDRGGFLFHGKIKALADAAREGGLKF